MRTSRVSSDVMQYGVGYAMLCSTLVQSTRVHMLAFRGELKKKERKKKEKKKKEKIRKEKKRKEKKKRKKKKNADWRG